MTPFRPPPEGPLSLRCCGQHILTASSSRPQPGEADVRLSRSEAGFYPEAVIRLTVIPQEIFEEQSFDHLVGSRMQRGGYIDAEHPRGLEVEHQFECGRLQHGKVGGLSALENVPVNSPPADSSSEARPITDEAPGSGELAERVNRGNLETRRVLDDLVAPDYKKRIGAAQKRVSAYVPRSRRRPRRFRAGCSR